MEDIPLKHVGPLHNSAGQVQRKIVEGVQNRIAVVRGCSYPAVEREAGIRWKLVGLELGPSKIAVRVLELELSS